MNSDNLEEIKPELSEDNKSRIASAFAQTDATQKSDQLSDQMADQDAISGTVLPAASANGFGSNSTTSSATGDIKIPGMKKKSKAPLILAAVVLLIAGIGAGAYSIVQNLGGSEPSADPTTLFAKYRELVVDGTEQLRTKLSESVSNDGSPSWFFFKINQSIFTNSEREQYLKEVSEKYTNFEDAVAKCPAQTNETNSLEILMTNYEPLLTLMIQTLSINALKQEVLSHYTEGGESAAYNYIVTTAPTDDSNDTSQSMRNSLKAILRSYLDAELNLIQVYDTWGCVSGNSLDLTCSNEYATGSVAFLELTTEQSSTLRLINTYSEGLWPDFMTLTNSISAELESNDE